MNAPLAKEQIKLLETDFDNLAYRNTVFGDGPARKGFGRIAALVRRSVAAFAELRRRQAVLDELSQLTDRELADIGLRRADLHRVFDPRFAQARKRGLGWMA